MGFTVTDSWTTSRWDKTLNILHVSIGSLIPTAITNHVPEFTKRPILLFTSAAINFGLFYTIMTHATIAPDTIKDLTNHSQNKLIAIFDLSNPELEPPVKNSPPVQQTRDQKDTQIPTPLDITPSIIPPEWSVSSITIANSNANDIGESNINSGNGTYDPYAGASPQREQKILSEDQSDTNMNIDYTGIDSTLDRAMFEEWVMKLRKRLSRANGMVELSVILSDDGRIIEVDIMKASASKQLQLFVRHDAMGKKLFPGSSGQKMLPEIRL